MFSILLSLLITPRACTRGKVIGSVIVVIVSTKIARSQAVGVLVSGHCCQDVINGEKAMSFCFYELDKDHKHYKSCFLMATPIIHIQ